MEVCANVIISGHKTGPSLGLFSGSFCFFILLFVMSFSLSLPLYGVDNTGLEDLDLPVFDDDEDWSKGPLYGNSLFLIYYNHFTFPCFSAEAPRQYDLEWGVSTYLTNDVLYFISKDSAGRETFSTERDYESLVMELDAEYSFSDGWMVGGMFRFVGYYGGFMDSVIESFHGLFNFPNGGRESADDGEVYINNQNDNNVNFFLDHAAFFFGDIDLWIKYTFYQSDILSFATSGGLKIPTGALSGLSVASTGYPDIALAMMGDLHMGKLFSLYLLTGVTLPFDAFNAGDSSSLSSDQAHPYPFFQGNLCVEFHPVKLFSLLAQFAFKSPVVSGGVIYPEREFAMNDYPQTDLLVGFIFEYNDMKWQFYFEEDPFTYQGNDITFNIRFSQKINLKK